MEERGVPDRSGNLTAQNLSGWIVPVALSCLLHVGGMGGAIFLKSWFISVPPRIIPIELVSEPKIEPPKVIQAPAPAVMRSRSPEMPPVPKTVDPPRPQPAPVAETPPPPTPRPDPVIASQLPPVALPQTKATLESLSKSASEEVNVVQEPRPVTSPPGPAAPSTPSPAPPIARDGGGTISLSEALADSRLGVASRSIPRYPESARRAGAQGTTLIKVLILATGKIGEIQIEESAGHPALDQAAIDAVRRWRFEPGKENGRPVDLWVLIPLEFKLVK